MSKVKLLQTHLFLHPYIHISDFLSQLQQLRDVAGGWVVELISSGTLPAKSVATIVATQLLKLHSLRKGEERGVKLSTLRLQQVPFITGLACDSLILPKMFPLFKSFLELRSLRSLCQKSYTQHFS